MDKEDFNYHVPAQKIFIKREVYDHEIFLAFNDDTSAYMFNDWWLEEGRDKFLLWVSANSLNYYKDTE